MGPVLGAAAVPGSKSITNRALLMAALAEGTSTLIGALVADDTSAMVDAVRALGAVVVASPDGTELVVQGTAGRLPTSAIALYAGQGATVARFVAAVAAASPVAVTIDAHPQLRARPMKPLLDALVALGARVRDTDGALPVTIIGPAAGGKVTVPAGISSQFISALLMAGPLFPGGVEIDLEGHQIHAGYVTMTSAVMEAFGVHPALYAATMTVGPATYAATTYEIEPDASSASYFFAAAAVTGGDVQIHGIGARSLQADMRFARILADMGAKVDVDFYDTTVTGGELHGVDVDLSDCADTLPTLAVVAACASSPTTIRGVAFVRHHETDRIAVTARELRRCGVRVDEFDDGLTIHPGPRTGALIDPDGDHRMAMAFSILGLVTPGMAIDDPGCVAKTFPGFYDALDSLLA